MRYDVIIAGGGIVGLATALRLQQMQPGIQIAVLDKESTVAAHQSSHNSGVIHSGIYYRPGSLRALNCKRGYDQLLTFCRENNLPFDICGKIIVATNEAESAQLDTILTRGQENGLQGIRKMSRAETLEIEPHVECRESIWVPQAGIVDYGAVARKYAELLEQNGGKLLLNQAVAGIQYRPDAVVVETQNPQQSAFEARLFINCGGLYSDKIARMSGENPDVQILPFRGEFYHLKPASEKLVRNLIYPTPNPSFPFLGVHFTRMIGGGIEAGPNAVLAYRREGYSRWDLNLPELAETLTFPGFQKLARKYWRDGWAEMKRSYSKAAFVQALQRLVPAITPADLEPGRSGVRAMACDRAGNLLDDFLILTKPRTINVCNAPSPAATASLAVGETVALQAVEQLGK